jgi:surface antigen
MLNKKLQLCVALGSIFASLVGCSSEPGGVSKSTVGLALGSVAGGVAGSYIPGGNHLAGTLIGAAAGGAAGAAIGAALDEQDRQEMARLTQLSFETGQDQEFTSPRTNARVQVKVVKTVTVAKKLCRTVQQDVELKDNSKTSESVTACKGPNGWVV